MIKRLLTLLIFIPTLVSGQDWAPVGARWYYDHDYGLPPYLTVMESVRDTIILNKSCRELVTNQIFEFNRPNGTFYWDTTLISRNFIYNSNDTVYHYNKYDSSFYPLYLLNISPNDTILIRDRTTPCTMNEYFCSRFEYVVDSVSSISLQGNNLKMIYNSATSSSDWMFNRPNDHDVYPIIDRIGSLKSFFGVSEMFVLEGEICCLRCYTDSLISFKSSYWTNDCDYLRPLHEPLSIRADVTNDLVVYPNPFNSFINISKDAPTEFELYDSFGRLIMKGKEKVVNTAFLKEGIYLLKLTLSKSGNKTIRIIKHLP
ncbi:MAG TPA: hypothetical protein DCR43_02015 [Bacteroidales bacterium]|nr:MAG: hypothetical protein A2X11_06745 [Bacteroidetes bacterium GWE2_42_24]OFY24958.1 MAG: hypothetical protein A2X09_13245 [Bacteroidetes bacterium GWF2_43_11]HAQ64624.1 hypothetical protein [Bacteroidales bacterium]HBZ68033.1 hypothetical protein [Bacteroidales bacterium]